MRELLLLLLMMMITIARQTVLIQCSCEPEVDDLQFLRIAVVPVVTYWHHDVVRLDVPMDDSLSMHVSNPLQNGSGYIPCSRLREGFLFPYPLVQWKVQLDSNDIQHLARVKILDHLENVLRPDLIVVRPVPSIVEKAKAFHLLAETSDVIVIADIAYPSPGSGVVVIEDRRFRRLDGVDNSCRPVSAQGDLSECPRPELRSIRPRVNLVEFPTLDAISVVVVSNITRKEQNDVVVVVTVGTRRTVATAGLHTSRVAREEGEKVERSMEG